MLGFVTGVGLAAAAGLNAYVPLILMGLLARFTPLVTLPEAWAWLADEWLLGGLAVLLLVEVVADKIPAVDSVNDVVQTVVRPGAGGVVFGAGSSSRTFAVDDVSDLLVAERWVPVLVGLLVALGVHLLKSSMRPVINVLTLGAGGAVVSVAEDGLSVGLTVLAVLAPVLAVLVLLCVVIAVVRLWRRRRGSRPLPATGPVAEL